MITPTMTATITRAANGKHTPPLELARLPPILEFELPPELEATEPPEARGLARDDVRLMVSHLAQDQIEHARFRDLPEYLRPGDVLVINTSGTLSAALEARRADGTPLELHLSTRLPAALWVVELRQPAGNATVPFLDGQAGETLSLPAGASVTLHTPHAASPDGRVRLWIATLRMPEALTAGIPDSSPEAVHRLLDRYGFPIRYNYVRQPWPAEYYQTVYATEPGSAEMPSAGRAFTAELITRLVACGVQVLPLVLHTGVASLEAGEPPYEEYYRVPAATARMVNLARATGQRVIAAGTTAVRALETVADDQGMVYPGEGWTDLVVTPERGLRVVTGLLTGLHEPRATHLAMLAALAGYEHLRHAYAEAIRERYLWHEFGDLHLILPD